MNDVKRCAACRQEKPVSEMKVCMHNQMHRYVCDMKRMNDFYNPPSTPAARCFESEIAALAADNQRLRDALVDAADSLEELAFVDELKLTCQSGVVIRCACKSCVTDRAINVLSVARKLAALAGSKGGG